MNDLISRLSEIRSEYNCFDEDEEPYYRAVSEAIRILSRCADGDTISRQTTIDKLNERQRKLIYCFGDENDMVRIMDIAKSIVIAIPSVQQEPLTDSEQRIFLKAISREKEVCKKTDEELSGELNLVGICNEIERKVKGALWT